MLSNRTDCSPCLAPTAVFDANLGVCVAGCPAGTVLNTTLRSCVSTACPYPGQVLNATTKTCVCDTATPYFTGYACISCFAPSYWNSSSSSCQTCDMSNQFYYSPDRASCLQCPPSAPISIGLTCANCNQTSYYDASSGKCIACPNNKLYSPVTQRCECPQGLPFFNGQTCSKCGQY